MNPKFNVDFRWVWVYKTSDYSYQLLFTNFEGGGYMMKKSVALIGIIGLVLCFSIMMTAGCAKKSVVKEQLCYG